MSSEFLKSPAAIVEKTVLEKMRLPEYRGPFRALQARGPFRYRGRRKSGMPRRVRVRKSPSGRRDGSLIEAFQECVRARPVPERGFGSGPGGCPHEFPVVRPRSQGMGRYGRCTPCPSSAMSSGRLSLIGLAATKARLRFTGSISIKSRCRFDGNQLSSKGNQYVY